MEISQAIAMLPDQCLNIMKMSYEQGMSGKQIAEAMQITVSTVNNRESENIGYRMEEATKVNGVYQEYPELKMQILEAQRKHAVRYPDNFASLLLLNGLGMSDHTFGVHSIPAYFFVNKKGIIVYNSKQSDLGLEGLESATRFFFTPL